MKITPQHSDDRLMRPVRPNNRPDKTGGLLSAFMPGGQGLLAKQLNAGFGGGNQQWQKYLGQVYSPTQMRAPFEYGIEDPAADPKHPKWRDNHGVDNPRLDEPNDRPDPTDGWSPRSNLAMLGGQQQMQLTPEMIAMIRQRLAQRG